MQYCRITSYDKLTYQAQPTNQIPWEEGNRDDWHHWCLLAEPGLVWPEQRREGEREKHPTADKQNRYSGKYFYQRIEFLSSICFCFLLSCFARKIRFPPRFMLPGVKIDRNWPKLYDVGGLGGASTAWFTNHNLVRSTAADGLLIKNIINLIN